MDVGRLLELDGGGGGRGLLELIAGRVLELLRGVLELLEDMLELAGGLLELSAGGVLEPLGGMFELAAGGVLGLLGGVFEEAIGQLEVYEVRVLVLLSVDTIVETYV
jgi:hypothetical protein